MSDAYEMKGSVRVQGRPGVNSDDGTNWCYTFTFIPTLTGDVCDLTIFTEDTGAALWPGPLSLNPEINPTGGPAGSVHSGLTVTTGAIGTDAVFKPEGSVRYSRGKLNGKDQKADKATDRLNVKFNPCLKSGKPFQVKLCFGEELDENDVITFVPSFHDGSSPLSGDATPSSPLTIPDLLRLLGGLGASAGSKLLGRVSNDDRRALVASLVRSDRELRAMLANDGVDAGSTIQALVKREGVGPVLEAVSAETLVEVLGARRVLEVVGAAATLQILGVRTIVTTLRELGVAQDVATLLSDIQS